MKNLATHTTLLLALASLVLLLPSGAPVADEPVDPADEISPAITDPAEAAEVAAEEPAGMESAAPRDRQVEAPAATETDSAGNPEIRAEADRPAAPERGPEAATDPDSGSAATAGGPPPVPSGPVERKVAVPAAEVPPTADDEADAAGGRATGIAAGIAIDGLDDDADTGGTPEATAAERAGPPIEEGPAAPLADAVRVADATTSRTLTLLNTDVLPGTYQRLSLSATEMFEDLPVATPVLVVNGRSAGPTLCVTAAVHGDELNGIEMVRRVMHDLDPKTLSGAVIGVPIVNLQGFRRGSRYLPDRRDLNRYFPGNPRGSAASRIAHSFFNQVIEHCDALVDLHTGSFDRANLPQLRADLRNPDVVTLTHGFGATVILHSEPADGTLRFAATSAGIPTVTLEAGGPSQLELKEVMHGVKGIETLLNTLGMVAKVRFWGDQQPVYYRSSWVRANRGGILLADVSLGSTVRRGDLLGTITDPMNNASTNLYSPYSGRVIGMARNQVVMPGFAAFHVGIQAVDTSAVEVETGAEPDAAQEEKDDGETLAREEAEAGKGDYVDGMSE
jgi:predicted deacylase